MFSFFSCCTSHEGEYAYEVREDSRKVSSSDSVQNLLEQINTSKQSVIKVKRSKKQNVIKTNPKEKARDIEFPPSSESLGVIDSVSTCNWKRLSEIVSHPILFSTTKSNVVKKSVDSYTGDYFLSAISAIAQSPKRIRDILVTDEIPRDGIYVIRLRVNGEIEEIVIDDYVPVNEYDQPLFCAPSQSQIWIPLVQKAWAKVNKSYENILSTFFHNIGGTSAQVFKALNFAPSEIFYLDEKQQKKQKLWKLLTDSVQRNSPVTCLTSQNSMIDWIHLNLIKNYHYTLIYAAEVYHNDKKSYRLVKLRNLNSEANWEGKGSISDKQFWNQTLASQQKNKFTENLNQKGDFIMLYTDFVRYFFEVNISYQLQQGNFIWEEIFFNGKNGSFWEIEVTHPGEYSFELHQESLRNLKFNEQEERYGRSTIILARVNEGNSYEYVSGTMRFTEEDTLVNAFLSEGKYMIYAKIEHEKGRLPGLDNKSSISCYSNKLCRFNLMEKKNCPNFLQTMFLNYARVNKRQEYNRDRMWISWKLLFKECGFAYIAFGNRKDSDKKFKIKFETKDFEAMHFKLKRPFKPEKGKTEESYEITVMPGEEKIILARVQNKKVMTLKFPPPIEMKIEDLEL